MISTATCLRSLLILILILGLFSPLKLAHSESLSLKQKKEVEKIVSDFLKQNPEVIINAIKALHQGKREENVSKNGEVSAQSHAQLLQRLTAPTTGNPEGDVRIVEFFDYQCGYCKQVFDYIPQLLKEDNNVLYTFVELPILSRDSEIAARAALAVWKFKTNRYLDFHAALMKSRGRLSKDRILNIALGLGLNIESIRAEMNSPDITKILNQNRKLARMLKIRGTPAFLIGGKVISGAIDLQKMKHLIAKVRKKG